MNVLKRKFLCMACLFIISFTLYLACFMVKMDDFVVDFTMGMSFGIGICTIVKMIQYITISKNPEKIKQLEILEKDERFGFIRQKALSYSFYSIVIGKYCVGIIAIFIGQGNIGVFLCIISAIEIFIFLIYFTILERKY